MVYKYLEIIEKTDDMERVPNHFKGDVVDRDAALTLLEAEKVHFSGLSYKARLVTCNHSIPGPCDEEVLEEVNL